MLITGIRHQVNAEYDSQRSALFMRYLFHYLQMFALLGIIIPALIGIDYYCAPKTKDEKVINKFYKSWDNMNSVEYHILTDSYRFLSSEVFYEHTNIDDKVTLHLTPIFHTFTFVSHMASQDIYTCKPDNIYGWPIIVAGLTFISSLFFLIKAWGWKKTHSKYHRFGFVANLGLVNLFLCAITIVAILFRIPY